MAKRLALTLIVAGAIGTCAGLLNVNKAEKINSFLLIKTWQKD